MESLQVTFGALLQHTYREAYQSGYVWGQSLVSPAKLLPHENWRWKQVDQMHVPHWIKLGEAATAVQEFIKRGCDLVKGCRGRCKFINI